MQQTYMITVRDHPETVCRTVGTLRRRRADLRSITVAPRDSRGMRQMTAVVEVADPEQLARQLERLIDVVAVRRVSADTAIERELALIRVVPSANHRNEVLARATRAGARVVPHDDAGLALELVDTPERIDGFLSAIRPFGLREVHRSGAVVLPSGHEPPRVATRSEPKVLLMSPDTPYRWQADGGSDDVTV